MKNIVVCGDSFSIGIGCLDLRSQPFGSLLAKKLNRGLVNYAKGSSTNFSIFLQVKYALTHVENIDFICIGITSYNRVEWFPGHSIAYGHQELTNEDVRYEGYGPYTEGIYQSTISNPMKGSKGTMFTENYYGIIDYVDNVLDNKKNYGPYFGKFNYEVPEKLRLLKQYYLEVFDERIQRQYDIGMICLAHTLLQKHGINHYIIGPDASFKDYVPEENLVHIDWGDLSLKYPDELNTLHTSPEGQYEVYQKMLYKITGEYDPQPYMKNPYLYVENHQIKNKQKLI